MFIASFCSLLKLLWAVSLIVCQHNKAYNFLVYHVIPFPLRRSSISALCSSLHHFAFRVHEVSRRLFQSADQVHVFLIYHTISFFVSRLHPRPTPPRSPSSSPPRGFVSVFLLPEKVYRFLVYRTALSSFSRSTSSVPCLSLHLSVDPVYRFVVFVTIKVWKCVCVQYCDHLNDDDLSVIWHCKPWYVLSLESVNKVSQVKQFVLCCVLMVCETSQLTLVWTHVFISWIQVLSLQVSRTSLCLLVGHTAAFVYHSI